MTAGPTGLSPLQLREVSNEGEELAEAKWEREQVAREGASAVQGLLAAGGRASVLPGWLPQGRCGAASHRPCWCLSLDACGLGTGITGNHCTFH